MRPSTIWYILKQGFKNIRRNWMFSVASVMTMAACIFLFGIFYSIINNVNYIAKSVEERVPVTVFFNEGTTQDQINEIGDLIRQRPEVAEIKYESADTALEGFIKDYFPDDPSAAQAFLEDNPLVNSSNYQVSVKNIEEQDALVKYIASLPNVRSVKQAQRAARTLGSINQIVYVISVAVIGILLVISIFLISNTIAVGITVRSEEIGIMKYIGATDRFVRAPFVLEGVLLGVVGAALPLIALYFGYRSTVDFILTRYSVLTGSVEFMPANAIFRSLCPIGILLGVGIGFVGSFWSTRKHLRV